MKNSFRIQKKHKITVALFLVMTLVFSLFVMAGNDNLDKNSEYPLGLSGTEITGDVSLEDLLLDISEQGSLEAQNLIIKLLLSDDVVSVRMTAPSQTDETSSDESDNIGGEVVTIDPTAIDGVDSSTSRRTVLGASDDSDTTLGQSGESTDVIQVAEFNAPSAGLYTFELLDGQGEVMATADYQVFAVSSILLGNGDTLILGPAPTNKYVVIDSATSVPSPGDIDWDTVSAVGIYGDTSAVSAVSGAVTIRSDAAAATSLRSFTGAHTDLTIVEGSDIIFSAGNSPIGISVQQLIIGEESLDTPSTTKVSVISQNIGIEYSSIINLGKDAQLKVEAKNSGIKYSKAEGSQDLDDGIFAFENAIIDVTVSGDDDAVGIQGNALNLEGTGSINVNAVNGKFGIQIYEDFNIIPNFSDGNEHTDITVYSKNGTAIQASSLNVNSITGKIEGTTDNGEAGIRAIDITVSADSSQTADVIIKGSAANGFGIVTHLANGDLDGNISIYNATLEGYAKEGIGISTANFNISSTSSAGGALSSVKGTADKGIGVSAFAFDVSSGILEGISGGSTTNHYQTENSIPDSAGINALGYLNIDNNSTIKGTAPKSDVNSYGIHVFTEDDTTAPEVSGNGQFLIIGAYEPGKIASVTAEGGTGIYVPFFGVQGANFNLDTVGGVDGMVVGEFDTYAYDGMSNLNTTGETGNGLTVGKFADYKSLQLEKINLNATGAVYGLEASLVPYSYNFIAYSNLNLKSTGTSADTAGGYFHFTADSDDIEQATITLRHSEIIGSSVGNGLLFEDAFIDIESNGEPVNPLLQGEGSETGVLFQYSPSFLAVITSGNRNAINTDADSPITIHGISSTTPVNKVARKAAVVIPNFSIADDTTLVEEYLEKSTKPVSATPDFIYANNMNIKNNTNYAWATDKTSVINGSASGLSSQSSGEIDVTITGQRTASATGEAITLTSGIHKIIMHSDVNMYTVSFDVNGGTPQPVDIILPAGSLVTDPGTTLLGHHINRWEETSSKNVWNFATSTTPLKDILLKVYWTPNDYVITFNGVGNTGGSMNPQTYYYGQQANLNSNAFTKTDYSFVGWDTNAAASTVVYKDNEFLKYTYANDIDLYAVWKDNPTIKVEYYIQHPSTGVRTAIGTWPTDARGLPNETLQTVALSDADYYLIAVEEWAQGATAGTVNPLADYLATFPALEKTTTIKYIYLESVEAPLINEMVEDQEPLDVNDIFGFTIWLAGTPKPTTPTYTSKIDDIGILLDGLLAGQTYYVEQNRPVGYLLDDITINGITLSKDSIGYYFVAPQDTSQSIVIHVANRHHILADNTVQLTKKLTSGQEVIDAKDDTFSFTAWRAETDKPASPHLSAKINGNAIDMPGIIAGQKYYLEEQHKPFYRLESIMINGTSLAKDDTGYYFIAPVDDAYPMAITVTNEIDYLPDGTMGILKEMGFDDENNQMKPLANNDSFKFSVWEHTKDKPARTNYSAIVNRNKPEPLEKIIAGFKYYIDEDGKNGYILESFIMNGTALQKDNKGYYFVAPTTADEKVTITAVNILDDLPDGTLFIEKVMTDFQQPLGEFQRFSISTRLADRSGSSSVEKYTLIVNDDREEMVNLTAGGRYYVLEEEIKGYELDKVLYAGEEMERDDTGYFFTAPVSGRPAVITVVNRLAEEDNTIVISKYIDNKLGGAPELPVETFKVEITGPEDTIAKANIDSTTGEVTWVETPEKWIPGEYQVEEILDKDTVYTHSKTTILINGEDRIKGEFFQLEDGDIVEINLYNLYEINGENPDIPNAGGLPLSILAIFGAVFVASGVVLHVVSRKKKFSK